MRGVAFTALVVAICMSLAVCQIPLNPDASGIAGAALSGVGAEVDNAAANCNQIEFDIFNIGATNAAANDIFQYINLGDSGSGTSFSQTTPYVLSVPSTTFPGGIQLEIILSPQQAHVDTGIQVAGPFNASVNNITVILNAKYILTELFTSRKQLLIYVRNVSDHRKQFHRKQHVRFCAASIPSSTGLPIASSCAASYVLQLTGTASATVKGDPQFIGLRGQSYQVHSIDGAVYNLISDEHYQLNARFGFLNGPRPCPIMPSTGHKSVACWAHEGSYIVELGLMLGDTQIYIKSGAAHSGFDIIQINNKSLNILDNTSYISYNTSHEIILSFFGWILYLENSDYFINIHNIYINPIIYKTLSSHGLLGQTWNNKIYHGMISAIQGEVEDYLIEENNVFGKNFLYNKFV